MDPPEDDIQFDFFDDDPVTAETPAPPRVRLPRRAGRPPRRTIGPPRGGAPLVRLLALVFFVIFIVLFFALVIQSCTSTSKKTSYSNYLGKVNAIAAQSTTDGKNTVAALTSPSTTIPAMVTKLKNISAAEQQNVKAAEGLSPPGRLRAENANLIEALQLRVNGVTDLANTFQASIAGTAKTSEVATALSEDAQRLLASDIIFDDLFIGPVTAQLKKDGVIGVDPQESHFLASPDNVITEHAMALVLQRIAGTSTTGTTGTTKGVHGTNLVSVAALPNGVGGTAQTLIPGQLNTVTTSSSLVFQVTIADGGDSQEVQIPITLTIARPTAQGGPITKTEKVQLIDPGSNAMVTFSQLGQVPFASQTTLTVDVAPVPGELNKANNSAQYNVIFALPTG